MGLTMEMYRATHETTNIYHEGINYSYPSHLQFA